jgi:tRNA(Ile)-lysidine synthase
MGLRFDNAIAAFAPELPLAVAFSGGADSTALLVACARRWPGRVGAIHVHHGLQAAADSFEVRCTSLCAELGVPLQVVRVDARHEPGESPEDAARNARYESLAVAAMQIQQADTPLRSIALAQHADDQVETVLLALSRGAGLAGIAGMRAQWERGGIAYHRPLLEVAGADLRAWLVLQGIQWIEDPSNANEQFTRNRIRARLLPALAEAFPQFRDTFGRTARHAAQAQALLESFAAEDLARVGIPPAIDALRSLPRGRRANLLRHWLRSEHGAQASAAQMEELLDQIEACATRGHGIRIKVATGFVERAGPLLSFRA